MNVSDIFTEARTLSYSTSDQFSDDQLTIWLNFEYQYICDEIKKTNENYFYTRWYMDTVAYQNKYSFTLPTSSVASIQKILQMTIKYENDTYPAWATWTVYTAWTKITNVGKSYIANVNHTAWATFAWDSAKWVQIYENYSNCREVNFSNWDLQRYNENMPDAFIDRYGKAFTNDDPVFALTSTTNIMDFQIYPWPTETVKDWIKYEALKTIIDLTKTSVEADILIDRNYHRILVFALLPYIYQAKWMYNEQDFALQKFLDQREKMLSAITDRNFSATEVNTPSLTLLQ